MSSMTPSTLCAARLSITTIWPGWRLGHRTCSRNPRKTSPSVADSIVIDATHPETPTPPSSVKVFQCPAGTPSLTRAPSMARLHDAVDLVRRQVVHHHDLAGLEVGAQNVFQESEEDVAVCGRFNRHRRHPSGDAHPAQQRQGFPVSRRNALVDPRTVHGAPP